MAYKHTPGPWEARINHFTRWEIMYAEGQIANVSKPDDPASPPASYAACEANARLMAAAPDLLEALEIAREYALYASAEPGDIAGIDAALAKATGEPK